MTGFSVRRLAAEDAEAWRAVRLEALQREPDAFGATYGEEAARPVDWFRERVSAPDPIFGGFADGALIGTAGYHRDHELKQAHRAHVWAVYVAPAHRRQGVARSVMQALTAEASANRISRLVLGVTAGSAGPYDFYRSLGFAPYGIEPDAKRYEGRSLDLVLMSLKL
jgi:L-amino acid N-acyltransferase YncA